MRDLEPSFGLFAIPGDSTVSSAVVTVVAALRPCCSLVLTLMFAR